jgi:Zn-dependent peptidase ImmA (M78 family)
MSMRLNDDEDFETAARELRIKLSIDDQLRPDMHTVIFKLKDHGMIKNYVRVPDAEMPDDEAYFDSEQKLLYLRESTFCAANAMYTYSEGERRRARYTIAHEVAHVALGHDGVRFRGQSNALAEKVVHKIRRQEREAQRFAAAFLAPAHLA